MSFPNRFRTVLVLAMALAVFGGVLVAKEASMDWASGEYTGSRDEVLTLMGFYDSIELTAEQEAVRQEALGPLPAACCNEFSMATCCCVCNLSRSIWGLSKHLIAERGASAEVVRKSVEAWVAAINPDGYQGKTCTTGQCGKPFKEGGCGGMNPNHLVHSD